MCIHVEIDMFWGYSPALDLLREYFRFLDGKPHRDAIIEAEDTHSRGEELSEEAREASNVIKDADTSTGKIDEAGEPADGSAETLGTGNVDRDGEQLTSARCDHVQADNSADDGGRRGRSDTSQVGDRSGGEEEAEAEVGRGGVTLQDDALAPPASRFCASDVDGGQPVHHDGADRLPLKDVHHHTVRAELPVRRTHVCGDSDRGEKVSVSGAGTCEDLGGVGTDGCAHSGQSYDDGAAVEDSERSCGERDKREGRDSGMTGSVVSESKVKQAMWDPFNFFSDPPRPKERTETEDDDTFNILLVGSADARHLLKTLSRLHRHYDSLRRVKNLNKDGPPPKVRIFVVEGVMELVARQLVLILAALEPEDRLGRKEKVRLMMEVFGNALVRPVTTQWVQRAAALLVHLVTDSRALARRLPVVDLSHLRHQDRDRLEDILAFYQQRPQTFRIGFHWDQRLRRHLKTRYDTRTGAYDWDYHMTLKDLPDGEKVCSQEYRHWRETGVAFTWLEGEQTEPNLTLAAGIFREGSHLLHGGYLGDIITSPYVAFALQVEKEDENEMFRRENDRYVQRSTDVTERHLARITFELQHREQYVPPKVEDSSRSGVLLTEVTDVSRLNPEAPGVDDDDATLRCRRGSSDQDMLSYAAVTVPNAQVVFLSPRFLRADGGHAHVGRFHVAVIARGLADKRLDGDLVRSLAPGALVLVEGTRFLLERREGREQYASTVRDLGRAAGLRPVRDFNPHAHDNACFTVS